MKKQNKFFSVLLSFLAIFLLLSLSPVYGTSNFPNPTANKYINDYVGILSNENSSRIISIGKELEDKTGAQAVIVIVDSTEGLPIESYSLNLFRSWGIGEKNKDNGLLLLLAVNDKAWRVEVGRGLEGAVPDALSNRIMTSIGKPSFIKGDYGEGILNSYSALTDSIAKEYNITLDKSLNISIPSGTPSNNGSPLRVSFTIGAVVLLFFLDIIFNRGRVSSFLLQVIFWSSIGRRNGPGGGGFGGFGGGSSNGGGSSGSW